MSDLNILIHRLKPCWTRTGSQKWPTKTQPPTPPPHRFFSNYLSHPGKPREHYLKCSFIRYTSTICSWEYLSRRRDIKSSLAFTVATGGNFGIDCGDWNGLDLDLDLGCLTQPKPLGHEDESSFCSEAERASAPLVSYSCFRRSRLDLVRAVVVEVFDMRWLGLPRRFCFSLFGRIGRIRRWGGVKVQWWHSRHLVICWYSSSLISFLLPHIFWNPD